MQFILQKSEKPSQSVSDKQDANKMVDQENIDKLADARQPNNLMEKQSENVGIVKGIPQQTVNKTVLSIHPDNNAVKMEVMKDRKTNFGHFPAETSNLISSENLLDLYSQQRLNSSNNSNGSNYSSSSPVTSPIGVSGSLKPPAYRNPPAPKSVNQNQKLMDVSNGNFSPIFSTNDVLIQNVQYRDLVQLIKYQREKINTQQSDLTKVRRKYRDATIMKITILFSL